MLDRRGLGMCLIALVCFLFLFAPPRRTVCAGFLPPNHLKILVSIEQAGGITHEQYDEVLDRLEEIYGPIVAAKGGKLQINRLWDDPTVNSDAWRRGKVWNLDMYGGLARYPAITQDGEALVACHEMSHHLGGAPKIKRLFGRFGTWASDEGEADYAGALKCMRRMFSDEASARFTRTNIPDPVAQKACQEMYRSPQDRALCVRVSAAALSVTALFKALSGDGKDPHFDTPDPSIVKKTDDSHPATQCRLDTYFAADLCTQPVSSQLSDSNPAPGACTRSQGYSVGMRPLCWYKPPAGEPADMIPHAPFAPQMKKAVLKSGAFSTLKNGPAWP